MLWHVNGAFDCQINTLYCQSIINIFVCCGYHFELNEQVIEYLNLFLQVNLFHSLIPPRSAFFSLRVTMEAYLFRLMIQGQYLCLVSPSP